MKKVKKLANGGAFKWSEKADGSNADAPLVAGASLASGIMDAVAPGDEYGVRSEGMAFGSSALKGAAAGAALGPAGAIVGGVAGGIAGMFGNKKARRERKTATANKMTAMDRNNKAIADQIMLEDPTNISGRKDAQMYKYGGTLKGAPSTYFKLPAAIARTPKVDILPTVAISPRKMMANGGSLKPLHSTAAEIKGPSHAGGGVKFPDLGVELEGGETVSEGFVFSKKLGFADQHLPIAKAIGKTEKLPDSPTSRRTLTALKGQEDRLKMKQEQTKQQLGIPSSLKMATGGDINAERRKAISARLNQIKAENRGVLFDDRFKGKPTPAHAEYKALLAENKKLIQQGNMATSGKNQGFIDALAANKGKGSLIGKQAAPLQITQTRNGKTTVVPAAQAPAPVAKTTAAPVKPKSTARTSGVKKAATAVVPRALINDPQLVDPQAIIASEAKKNAWIKQGLSPKSNIGSTIQVPGTIKPGVTAPAVEDQKTSISGVAEKVMPFVSNISNTFRKLPTPPTPTMQSLATPSLMNLDADRAEVTRQRRGADAAADANLNGGNAATASRAANLAQSIRGANAVNQAEANANSSIKNQFQQLNLNITAQNNAKQDQYNTQLVERQLKQQELTAENLADVGNKIQLQSRDQKLFDLENDKLAVEIGKDPTGAAFRTTAAVLKKRMTPAAYAALEQATRVKEQNAKEENVALRKMPSALTK